MAAYDGEFPFVKDNKKIEKIVSEKRSKNYEKLINDLVKASINNFPKAKIKIIQQSLPGCNYIDQYNVIDTYGTDHTPNYCRTMGEIYLSMDQAISEISPQYKSKISIHKMYLENTLKYEDVYDSVHTNNSGSRKIAEYIESLY